LYEQLSFVNNLSLGNLLLKRLLMAIPRAEQSRRDFVMFNSSLRIEIPDEVEDMERELAAWEVNNSHRDPYQIPKSSE
jgi:hypothetical protein